MKHLLNDLTEEEKNSIREQHTGGMNVVTENFSRLINTKSGNVKPLVNESSISKNPHLYYFKQLDNMFRDSSSVKNNSIYLDKVLFHAKHHLDKDEYEKVVKYSEELMNSFTDELPKNIEEDYSDLEKEFDDDESPIDCEHLFKSMDFIYDDYMSQISLTPDEIDEAEAEDIYDQFETELGGILDLANQTECDDKTIQDLEIVYNEYLSEMANKLGLR